MVQNEIEDGITMVLNGIETIRRNGKYRERVEALQVLDDMRWFDNFGARYYRRRLTVAHRIAQDVQDDDIPDRIQDHLEYF